MPNDARLGGIRADQGRDRFSHRATQNNRATVLDEKILMSVNLQLCAHFLFSLRFALEKERENLILSAFLQQICRSKIRFPARRCTPHSFCLRSGENPKLPVIYILCLARAAAPANQASRHRVDV
jgi:hypothetical protein